MNDGTDLFSQEGLFVNIQPSLHCAQVLQRFGICGDLFNRTSNISARLMAFFLAFSTCGKGGGVLFFTAFSLVTTSFGLASLAS